MATQDPKGTVKTQGTHLYMVDRPAGEAAALLKFVCPTGFTGVASGTRDQIENTCLDEEETKTFENGLESPGPVAVPFNFVPSAASHQRMIELRDSGEVLDWVALLSESATAPTLGAGPDYALVPPVDRTAIIFRASVTEFTLDASGNEIWRGTMTLNRRGRPQILAYTPAP